MATRKQAPPSLIRSLLFPAHTGSCATARRPSPLRIHLNRHLRSHPQEIRSRAADCITPRGRLRALLNVRRGERPLRQLLFFSFLSRAVLLAAPPCRGAARGAATSVDGIASRVAEEDAGRARVEEGGEGGACTGFCRSRRRGGWQPLLAAGHRRGRRRGDEFW